MNEPGLWMEFARLNPERWRGYDGYCQCEVCEKYREDAHEWIVEQIAKRHATPVEPAPDSR